MKPYKLGASFNLLLPGFPLLPGPQWPFFNATLLGWGSAVAEPWVGHCKAHRGVWWPLWACEAPPLPLPWSPLICSIYPT